MTFAIWGTILLGGTIWIIWLWLTAGDWLAEHAYVCSKNEK
jgi:hypothetical protein